MDYKTLNQQLQRMFFPGGHGALMKVGSLLSHKVTKKLEKVELL